MRARLRGPVGLAICSALSVALLTTAAAPAAAVTYSPIDRPGPPLTVDAKRLMASVRCTADLKDAATEPVLLVPATTVDSTQNFSFNYEPALRAAGVPYCTSDLPGEDAFNMNDIQNRADYLVYAIRYMHAISGRRIAMIGASQGGEAARWPLRFWPDTRPMVADVIALDSPNHGSVTVNGLCALPCAPALWQQAYGSNFIRALNSAQETFAGIDYTNIYTYTDDFVEPNLPGNSTVTLTGPGRITNVAIQDICPTMVADHLDAASKNPVAYELAYDAVTHDGPADPTRVSRAACMDAFTPGIDPVSGSASYTVAAVQVTRELATYPKVNAEPPLRCYVTAACGGPAGTPGAGQNRGREFPGCGGRRSVIVHVRRRYRSRLRSARVVVGRRVVARIRYGQKSARINLTAPPSSTTVRIRMRLTNGETVTDARRYRACPKNARHGG